MMKVLLLFVVVFGCCDFSSKRSKYVGTSRKVR